MINPNFKRPIQHLPSVDFCVERIQKGDMTMLSRVITFLESSIDKHIDLAQNVLEKLLPFTGKSIRIGITGVPGVGKSTFIEHFGQYVVEQGKKIAVLVIDPSSQKHGGSILGDKTRMEKLVAIPDVFIRPTPSKGNLGGVGMQTYSTMLLCEATGFDVIFIETVGVGQSEIEVCNMVDFFLLLMVTGTGDELQGIKRGIMEMADAIAITKSEGDNLTNAKITKQKYLNSLHLFPANQNSWTPKVECISALDGLNLEVVWKWIQNHNTLTQNNGWFDRKRILQKEQYFNQVFQNQIYKTLLNFQSEKDVEKMKNQWLNGKSTPYKIIQNMLMDLSRFR